MNPGASLTVEKAITDYSVRILNSGVSSYGMRISTGSTDTTQNLFYAVDSGISGSDFIIKSDGKVGIGTFTPGTAGLAVMSGNVGIGTTTLPGTPKLGVNGTIGTYGLATDASNYQMGTLSASNGNGTLGSTTLSCVRAGTGAVNCDINLTPLGTGSVVINAGANILYRCVGGTGDGLISVNNANASCPEGTWTATSLKIN